MEGNEKQKALTKLHEENLKKIAEAAKKLEENENEVLVAYIAGRLDGALDAKWISERSA